MVMKEFAGWNLQGGGGMISIGKKQWRKKTLCGHTLPRIDMIN